MARFDFSRARSLVRAAQSLALATLAFAAPSAFAFNVYTVGGDASCGYAFIQDAIDAAASNPGEDYVFIASNRTYESQHLVVTDQDIDIVGGFTDCSDFDPGLDQTTIGGTSGHSVFEIEGSSHVYISNLVMTGAVMDASHSGGGIYFGGVGALALNNSWVFANQAGYGGGIDVSPTGPTTLTLTASTVSGNTALVSGGGIRIEGQTTLTATHTPSQYNIYIAQNAALGQGDIGYGGGIEVLGPAVANVSSVVDLNYAPYGGGIAAVATSAGSAIVNLFTTDPAQPVTLYGNQAASTGGGIFLKPLADGSLGAKLCAQEFAIDANIAVNGAAVYADEDSGLGSIAFFNNATCDQPAGAVLCAPGTACNEFNDNQSMDTNQQPTTGATVLVQSDGAFSASRFAARRNHGGMFVQFIADTAADNGGNYVHLHNCLMADNVEAFDLIDGTGGEDGTQIIVDTCTIANNSLGSPMVISANVNYVEVTNSIVAQPSQQTLDFWGHDPSDMTAHYVLTNDTTSLGGGSDIVAGTPVFVDAVDGDYHLVRTSPGVDMAPALDGVDLDGNPRTLDLVDVPNLFGPMDVGAYEIQVQGLLGCAVADTIFCNGFDLTQP